MTTDATALTRTVSGADTLHVVFRVGAADYAVPAARVVQMESFAGATPVPGAPPWVLGLMQIRGRVIPVIDLRVLFAVDATADEDARVVVVSSGERVVGLRVDRAREVVVLAPGSIQPVPPALLQTTAGYVEATAQAGDRLLLILAVDAILREDSTHGD